MLKLEMVAPFVPSFATVIGKSKKLLEALNEYEEAYKMLRQETKEVDDVPS